MVCPIVRRSLVKNSNPVARGRSNKMRAGGSFIVELKRLIASLNLLRNDLEFDFFLMMMCLYQ
jgi:hypothetical protein